MAKVLYQAQQPSNLLNQFDQCIFNDIRVPMKSGFIHKDKKISLTKTVGAL